MVISSRTPEGTPGRCPVCGSDLQIEPLRPAADAPCPHCGHLLWFTWDDHGDAQVVRPTDAVLRSELLNRLFDAVPLRKGVRLVLDLNDVRYLTSAALGALIRLKRKADAVRGKLQLRGVHPDLWEVFRTCRLDQVFEINEI